MARLVEIIDCAGKLAHPFARLAEGGMIAHHLETLCPGHDRCGSLDKPSSLRWRRAVLFENADGTCAGLVIAIEPVQQALMLGQCQQIERFALAQQRPRGPEWFLIALFACPLN